MAPGLIARGLLQAKTGREIMSGSDESDDDLVAGRVNRANDQTTIWAENRYEETGIGPI